MLKRLRWWVVTLICVVVLLLAVLVWLTSLGPGFPSCELSRSTEDGVERVMPVCP